MNSELDSDDLLLGFHLGLGEAVDLLLGEFLGDGFRDPDLCSSLSP